MQTFRRLGSHFDLPRREGGSKISSPGERRPGIDRRRRSPATARCPARSIRAHRTSRSPWISYFLGILTAAYSELGPRAEAVTAGRGSKAELVKSFVRSSVSNSFTFADVKRAAPGVSDEDIRQVLRDVGVVEVTGAGRGARWRRVGNS